MAPKKIEAIKKFPVDLKGLSPREKEIVQKLLKASELIAPIYLKQKNNKRAGANFYPADATAEEIAKAAKKNSAILNPYTMVERDKSGRLFAIPFHIKFKKELKPAARLILEAAEISDNKNFSNYLKSRADSLLKGTYEKSEIVWLTTETFKFGFVIGPIERYIDKLFFRKCAYQAWLGILDEKATKQAANLKNFVLSGRRRIFSGSEKVDISKVGVRVDNILIFSGLIADFMFTGTNLPNDVNLMKKYGSNLTIFKTSLEEKFNGEHYPIFKSVFSDKFQKKYSKEELFEGSLRCILLHEISHSLIRYKDAEKRLGNIFPVFDELLAYILGIQSCGVLILKGLMTQKELEAILIMHICRNVSWWLDSLKNPDVIYYAKGAAIALNFFFPCCLDKDEKGIYWLDFAKLFICIDQLSHMLEYHLALGSYEEGRDFVEEYGSFDVFRQFLEKSPKRP